MATHLLYSDLHLRPDRIAEAETCLTAIGALAVERVVPTGGYVINGGDNGVPTASSTSTTSATTTRRIAPAAIIPCESFTIPRRIGSSPRT